jgi:hypothetical protein
MDKLHAKIVTCKLAIIAQLVQQLTLASFADVENIVVQEQRRHAAIVTLVIVLTVTQFVQKTAQLISNIAERALRACIVTLQIKLHAKYVQEVDIPMRSSKHIANGVLRVSIYLIMLILKASMIIAMIVTDALMVNIERIKMIALVKIVLVENIYPQMRIVAMIMRMIVKFARTVDIVMPKVMLAPGVTQVNI